MITKQQADVYINTLELLESNLYSRKVNIKNLAKKHLSSEQFEQADRWLEANKASWNNPEKVQKMIAELKKQVLGHKVLNLEIAFEPSSKFLDQVSNWLFENLEQKVLIDLSIESTLIGGIKVGFNGRFKDLSVRKVMEENGF